MRRAEFKQTLYNIFEDTGKERAAARAVRQFLVFLIVMNVALSVIETVPDIQDSFGRPLRALQLVSGVIFLIEYVLRLYVADLHPPLRRYGPVLARLRYAVHLDALIDLIAVLPLLIAGQTLIRIARDELKSSANDQLTETARQVTTEINSVYSNAWAAPLSLIANGVDNEKLSVDAKIALLTLGIAELPDIVALQITVEGSQRPLLVTREGFSKKLSEAGLEPKAALRLSPATIEDYREGNHGLARQVQHLEGTGIWLASIILPLQNPLNGRSATLSARIDISRIKDFIDAHAFTKIGTITIVDKRGQPIFASGEDDLTDSDIVNEATSLLALQTRVISIKPYARPDGEVMLGAFSFPSPFDWAVIAEKSEAAAYYTIDVMTRNLLIWVGAGLVVAGLGAIFFSLGISRPILKIGQAAVEVGKGNFQARVVGVKSRDEIGELAGRINEMIVQINERFQLAKFVSHGTIDAIQDSSDGSVKLGGSRKRAAILFADIRGYTAFSESREPEVVVDVLNHYFAYQGAAVARNNGDIDKFVGDQIMAVFHGPDMSALLPLIGRERAKRRLEQK